MIRIEVVGAARDRDLLVDTLRPILREGDTLISWDANDYPASLQGASIREQVTGLSRRVVVRVDLVAARREDVVFALGQIPLYRPLVWSAQTIGEYGVIGA